MSRADVRILFCAKDSQQVGDGSPIAERNRILDVDAPSKESMRAEQNEKLVKRLIDEMWNARRLELADELFDPNCVTHQLRTGEDSAGSARSGESVKREAAMWLAGFPDLRIDLEQMIAADDLVVSRCTLHGTHTGVWMGFSATGKKVIVPMITIHRIVNEKIVEDWVLVGSLMLFQQLGLVPPTEAILQQ